MTDQKETNMTILDPDEVERLAQLREHIQQGVVPGQASGVFLMSVIDRQQRAIDNAVEILTTSDVDAGAALEAAHAFLMGDDG